MKQGAHSGGPGKVAVALTKVVEAGRERGTYLIVFGRKAQQELIDWAQWQETGRHQRRLIQYYRPEKHSEIQHWAIFV